MSKLLRGEYRPSFWPSALLSLLVRFVKRLMGKGAAIARTADNVERKYDRAAGRYIEDRYYAREELFCIVDNQNRHLPNTEFYKLLAAELRNILSGFQFKSILEVGAGELTTLESLYASDEVAYYAVDLSLNRLYHGRKEFMVRRGNNVVAAKANAVQLPFPDNSFDLVFTYYCLEQMPRDYQRAIDEICRVSKGNILLFEPSFELGNMSQKLRILNRDYVRGIRKYLKSLQGVELTDYFLLRHSHNVFNRAACYKIRVHKDRKGAPRLDSTNKNGAIPFVCPECRALLNQRDNHLFCQKCSRLYFVFDSIPILDTKYSLYVTEPKEH